MSIPSTNFYLSHTFTSIETTLYNFTNSLATVGYLILLKSMQMTV